MKNKVNKLWNYLDGHKTVIFMTAATIMQQAVNYDVINDSKGVNFVIGLTLTLGGGSLAHHVKKGLKKTK